MDNTVDSVIRDFPKEVHTFLETDKFKDELYVGQVCSYSNTKDALDKLVSSIHSNFVINCGSGVPATIYDYISDVIRYEYDHKPYGFSHKLSIITVDILYVPKKIVMGYSADNAFFKDSRVKEVYEDKSYHSPVCKLSDFVYVDTNKDKLYCGKKI